jgi:hypothetical protein
MNTQTKPWWLSVTLWIALLGFLIQTISQFSDLFGSQFPAIAGKISIVLFFLQAVKRFLDQQKPALTLRDKRFRR